MTFRKVLFWTHLAAGLTAGSVILVMALTGMSMAFERQILEFSEKSLRKIEKPKEGSIRLSADHLAGKAREAKPNMKVTGMTLQADDQASVAVSFGKGSGSLCLNPYTGAVLGEESGASPFLHQMEDIHRRLAWGDRGQAVTEACNVFFLFLILSGFYLWWPRNWNWASLKGILFFNPAMRGKQRDWNWHNVFGFWCLPVLLMTTLTGVVMSYTWANDLLYRAAGSKPPVFSKEKAAPDHKNKQGKENISDQMNSSESKREHLSVNLEKLFEKGLQKASSDWVSMTLRLPQREGGPISIWIQEKPVWWYPNARSQLTLDAAGEEKKWEPYAAHPRGRIWRVWARNLHTGEAFGLANQIFVFLGAAGAVMLVWTGFAMSWHRFIRKVNTQKVSP